MNNKKEYTDYGEYLDDAYEEQAKKYSHGKKAGKRCETRNR